MAPPRHSRTAAAETCSLPSGTYEPNRAAGPHLRLPVLLKTSLARGFLLPGGVRAWLPPPRDAPLLHRHPHLHLLSSTSTLQYPGSSIDLAHVRHHHCHDSSDDQARRLTTRSETMAADDSMLGRVRRLQHRQERGPASPDRPPISERRWRQSPASRPKSLHALLLRN